MSRTSAALSGITGAALLAAALSAADPALAGPQEFRSRASRTLITAESLAADAEAEVSFGRELAAHILGRYGSVGDRELNRYVNLVGKGVALYGSRSDLEFRFAVIDSDDINAYAAPGGYIFITRGALELMRDEAELAAVLAHEVAHVTQRHIVRELNIHGTEKAPEAGLARLLGASADPSRVAFAQAMGKAQALLFDSGLKKEDEFEADRVGTLLLAQTGYDPGALRRYLRRVMAVKGERTAIVHNTHPPFPERLGALDGLLKTQALATLDGPAVRERFALHVHRH